MRGITLIGMPAAGKSTIGKLLAQRLGWKFVDLDILIKAKTGRSPAEFIKEKGEQEFLNLEELCACGSDFFQTVFAPGGSIVYSPKAMDKLKSETVIFYLDLPLTDVQKRLDENLKARGIIGLAQKGLENIYKERTALYQRFAHHTIPYLKQGKEEIVNQIHQLLSSS